MLQQPTHGVLLVPAIKEDLHELAHQLEVISQKLSALAAADIALGELHSDAIDNMVVDVRYSLFRSLAAHYGNADDLKAAIDNAVG
jgi:hypothetical protein